MIELELCRIEGSGGRGSCEKPGGPPGRTLFSLCLVSFLETALDILYILSSLTLDYDGAVQCGDTAIHIPTCTTCMHSHPCAHIEQVSCFARVDPPGIFMEFISGIHIHLMYNFKKFISRDIKNILNRENLFMWFFKAQKS